MHRTIHTRPNTSTWQMQRTTGRSTWLTIRSTSFHPSGPSPSHSKRRRSWLFLSAPRTPASLRDRTRSLSRLPSRACSSAAWKQRARGCEGAREKRM
eukprot:2705008-Rhodomonas_salina.1